MSSIRPECIGSKSNTNTGIKTIICVFKVEYVLPLSIQRHLGHAGLTMTTRDVQADEPAFPEVKDIGDFEYIP